MSLLSMFRRFVFALLMRPLLRPLEVILPDVAALAFS
jgi:hypothetical protein